MAFFLDNMNNFQFLEHYFILLYLNYTLQL